MLEETKITKSLIKKYDKYSERPEGKGLIEACSNSVIVFAKHMLGTELYTWQKILALDIMAAMEDETLDREFVVLTSRQIGKSTFAGIFSLWTTVFNKIPHDVGNNSKVGVISASDEQATELIRMIKHYVVIGDAYCRKTYSRERHDIMDEGILSELVDPKETNNTHAVTLKFQRIIEKGEVLAPEYGEHLLMGSDVGSTIRSYPPTSVVLGKTFGLLHEDECGKTERFEDRTHWDYLHPTGDAYNAIRLYTSTPWVTSGFFYELCDPLDTKTSHPYKRYLFTIDAIEYENPKQYATVKKKIDMMRVDGKKDEVERGYYCRFVKGEDSFFNPRDVDGMTDEDSEMLEESTLPVDIGVDFGGQVKSRSVITVSHLDDDKVVRRLYVKSYGVGEDNNLMEDIEKVMLAFPNWQRIIPDECPQGDYIIRQMEERGWNVHPMNFRTWKVKKYGAFRSMLKKGRIKSFLDDDLVIEMKALEFSNSAQQSKIIAPRGYNDDLIDSFVMSSFFFLEDEGSWEFYTFDGLYSKDGD